MHKIAENVVVMAAKSVRSGGVLRSVFVAMMVSDMSGKEHKRRRGLNDAKPEVSGFVQRLGRPHSQMCMVVLHNRKSDRENQHDGH